MLISKRELIKELAAELGATQKDTRIVLECLENLIIRHIANQDRVKPFDGIMMEGVLIPEHDMYSPLYNKTIRVATKVLPKAKFSENFKQAINIGE